MIIHVPQICNIIMISAAKYHLMNVITGCTGLQEIATAGTQQSNIKSMQRDQSIEKYPSQIRGIMIKHSIIFLAMFMMMYMYTG